MQWKEVKGFKRYEVSDDGQVRNKKTGRVLKPGKNSRGYLLVGLWFNGKRTNKYVHRLVTEAFIPNPENKSQVNHMDEDGTNNRVDNLEWVTAKENNNWGNRTKKASETLRNNPEWRKNVQKFHERIQKPIYALYPDGTDEHYPSATIAAQELGLDQGSIVKVLKGQHKTCGGLRFEYAE